MKAHRLLRRDAAPEHVAGRVLCHDLRDRSGRIVFRKGQILQAADLPTLCELPWAELHLIEPEPGEVHEDEAGRRIAHAVAGPGIAVGAMAGGHWPLSATRRGILDIRLGALRRVNTVSGISVYTLYRGQVVDGGEAVARAKITPLVIDDDSVRRAEAAAGSGVIRVRPFRSMRVGAVVQESLGPGGMARFREALGEKTAWHGSTLLEPRAADATGEQVAAAIRSLIRQGAELVVLAGVRAMDPLDSAFEALSRLGIAPERHGVPAHPGSLFWMARLDGVPILGMPGCGLFSRATVFDLVLPRLLAGEPVGAAELAELGHGGFLTRDMAFRFPPYRPARGRGEVL